MTDKEIQIILHESLTRVLLDDCAKLFNYKVIKHSGVKDKLSWDSSFTSGNTPYIVEGKMNYCNAKTKDYLILHTYKVDNLIRDSRSEKGKLNGVIPVYVAFTFNAMIVYNLNELPPDYPTYEETEKKTNYIHETEEGKYKNYHLPIKTPFSHTYLFNNHKEQILERRERARQYASKIIGKEVQWNDHWEPILNNK